MTDPPSDPGPRVACNSQNCISDESMGTSDQQWDQGQSRRFRTEVFDADGDGEPDHIGLSQVHDFEDGNDATTWQRKVTKLTLDDMS